MSPTVRSAVPADREALARLFDVCPIEGELGLAPDRRPDFFAPSRLKGDRSWIGIVDGDGGRPVGCIAVDQRTAYVGGQPTRTMLVSDLRVRPDHRRRGIGGTLIRWARDVCVEAGGESVPTLVAILSGDEAVASRLTGHDQLPSIHRFASFRCWSIPLVWRRRWRSGRTDDIAVTRAEAADVDEMAELWASVAPTRQFAPVLDTEALAAWIEAAPGLEPSSYLLARDPLGRLAGFVGVWDQSAFKGLRVTSYSRRMQVFRRVFGAVAPAFGGTPLPEPGGNLRQLVAVHPCVPTGRPDVLRALLRAAYSEHRGRGWSVLTVGLDRADPLTVAVRGLLAQPTDVWTCVATLGDNWPGPPLDDRPAYHEIALV